MSETTDPTAGEHPAENDAAYREQAEALIADLRARVSHYEALLVHARQDVLAAASDRDFGVCTCGRALLRHKGGDRWWHAYGGGIDHEAKTVIPPAVPATPDAGDASECDGCQRRPCVCETVVLPSTEGLSEADLIDVIEAGWEDEPTAAEQELARTVARNILASDWLAAREAAARAEGLTDTADELWRIFLRLPNTPSPLGDYIQRRVAEFRDRAARIARESR